MNVLTSAPKSFSSCITCISNLESRDSHLYAAVGVMKGLENIDTPYKLGSISVLGHATCVVRLSTDLLLLVLGERPPPT